MKIKKTLVLIVIIVNLISLTACQKEPLKNDAPVGDQSIDLPMDFHETYGILEYITNTDNAPRILYSVEEKIAKDSEVMAVYLVNNGRLRRYLCPEGSTLGQFSTLSDEEIIDLVKSHYNTRRDEALNRYINEDKAIIFDKKVVRIAEESEQSIEIKKSNLKSGDLLMYNPTDYPIQAIGFTDDTGNRVVEQLLMLPMCDFPGIYQGRSTTTTDTTSGYELEYGDREEFLFSDSEVIHTWAPSRANEINPYFTVYDFFGKTTDPTKYFLNCWCEPFYFSQDSICVGTVYSSNYLGITSSRGKWIDEYVDKVLCFRDKDAYSLNIELDQPDSDLLNVDLETMEILNVCEKYKELYKNDFQKVSIDDIT